MNLPAAQTTSITVSLLLAMVMTLPVEKTTGSSGTNGEHTGETRVTLQPKNIRQVFIQKFYIDTVEKKRYCFDNANCKNVQ